MGKAAGKKKRGNDFASPYTLGAAVKKGDFATKLSLVICGAGNIIYRQFVKGFLFLAIEIAYIWFMIKRGFQNLSLIPSLGWLEQEEIWN